MSDLDTALIGALRTTVERMTAEVDQLREALSPEDIAPEIEAAEYAASKFWFAAWRESQRRLRIAHERILELEHAPNKPPPF